MKYIMFFIVLITSISTSAQTGIGTTTPDASAQLEVSSTSKGFLPPRITRDKRNLINAPVAGLQIWCSDCGSFGEMQVYNGNTWTNMIGGPGSGTVPDAPTNATSVGGQGEATITFNAPANNGGAAITGYTVTSSPDGLTSTGTSSPITLKGLTSYTSYTFSVIANNEYGQSTASSSSNSPIIASCFDTAYNTYDWFIAEYQKFQTAYPGWATECEFGFLLSPNDSGPPIFGIASDVINYLNEYKNDRGFIISYDCYTKESSTAKAFTCSYIYFTETMPVEGNYMAPSGAGTLVLIRGVSGNGQTFNITIPSTFSKVYYMTSGSRNTLNIAYNPNTTSINRVLSGTDNVLNLIENTNL